MNFVFLVKREINTNNDIFDTLINTISFTNINLHMFIPSLLNLDRTNNLYYL